MNNIAEIREDEAGLDVHLCGGVAPSARCDARGCVRFPVRFLTVLGPAFLSDGDPMRPEALRAGEERAGLGSQVAIPAGSFEGFPVVGAQWSVAPEAAEPSEVDRVGVALELDGEVVVVMDLVGAPVVVWPGETLQIRVIGGLGGQPARVVWEKI